MGTIIVAGQSIYVPRHNSEREVGHYWPDGRYDCPSWEDCAWNSTGMTRDVATGGAQSPTHEQMEKVRSLVMGPDGPTGSALLMAGIAQAWGWTPARTAYNATFETTWARVPVGGAAALMGRLSALPSDSRLRRWQPSYAGGHAICAVKLPDGRAWWDDPLAPSTYIGEFVSVDELRTYFGGLRVAGADTIYSGPGIAPIVQGVEMYPIVTVRPLAAPNPRPFTIKAGATVIGYDPATPGVRYNEKVWTADSTGFAVAEVAVDWANLGGQPRPVPSGDPFLLVNPDPAYGGAYRGQLLVKLAKLPDGSPAIVLGPADPVAVGTGVPQTQVDALVAAMKASTKGAAVVEIDKANEKAKQAVLAL